VRLLHRKRIEIKALSRLAGSSSHKLLISLTLLAWLAALDDFRNWLIREAA
jgi:hypothetical protein